MDMEIGVSAKFVALRSISPVAHKGVGVIPDLSRGDRFQNAGLGARFPGWIRAARVPAAFCCEGSRLSTL